MCVCVCVCVCVFSNVCVVVLDMMECELLPAFRSSPVYQSLLAELAAADALRVHTNTHTHTYTHLCLFCVVVCVCRL